MSKLYFSNDVYKQAALNTSYNDMNVHSYNDSFLQLINGLDYETLSVLCAKINDNLINYGYGDISELDCYNMTQNLNLSDELKEIVVKSARDCISDGVYLGTKLSSGFNVSSWLSHSYYVSECSGNLAEMMGLDKEKAMTYGLMHDYGRKIDFKFEHAIYGYQELMNIGYKDEAIGCLTHSFLNGGRCSNNEMAIEGFSLDSNGNPKWDNNIEYDDIKLFLDNYKYNEYDMILNISDLMATDKGIVSPYDRIRDIATRRKLDPVNRGYFLADFTNTLIDVLKRVDAIDKDTPYIKASDGVSLEDIEKCFEEVSKQFYVVFKQLELEKNNKKNL